MMEEQILKMKPGRELNMLIYQSKDGKEEKVFDALEWPRKRGWDASTLCHVFPCPE